MNEKQWLIKAGVIHVRLSGTIRSSYSPWRIRVDEKRPARYLAYLLRVKGEPQWVDMGEAAAIDRAVAKWRRALRKKQSHPYYWASFIQVGEWANLDSRR
jgi:CHAT domain-containing protein